MFSDFLSKRSYLRQGYDFYCSLTDVQHLDIESVYFMMSVFGYKGDPEGAIQMLSKTNFSKTLINPDILCSKFLNQCKYPHGTQNALKFIDHFIQSWQHHYCTSIVSSLGKHGKLDLLLKYWFDYRKQLTHNTRPSKETYMSLLKAIQETKKQARETRIYFVKLSQVKNPSQELTQEIDNFIMNMHARVKFGWSEWDDLIG